MSRTKNQKLQSRIFTELMNFVVFSHRRLITISLEILTTAVFPTAGSLHNRLLRCLFIIHRIIVPISLDSPAFIWQLDLPRKSDLSVNFRFDLSKNITAGMIWSRYNYRDPGEDFVSISLCIHIVQQQLDWKRNVPEYAWRCIANKIHGKHL